MESVHFHPDFGFLLIKIDPRIFNISDEHASFIDLKLDRTINLELKFNIQKCLLIDNEEQMTFMRLMKEDGFSRLEWQ